MKCRLVFLFLVCTVAASAQVNDTTASMMPPQVAGVLNFPKQFFFFDISNTTWLNAPDDVQTKLISGGLNINFLYEFNVISSKLGIAPGISYSVSGVKSNAVYDYEFNSSGSEVLFTDLKPYDTLYTKSKLSVSYLEIPLEVHIHLKPNNRRLGFLIAPGFRAGVLAGDFWKLNYHSSVAGAEKVKVYGIENISPFRYGVSLRLMYYKFGLFGYYQLNHLFEESKGPAITPFSIGVSVSPF
ncbi:MAG: PorT family protein [Chitinophagales bacterium]|nr:PorT family protein [Chitinophagales bacterium]